MVDLLYVPVFACHLICMNIATAAPLVCMWAEWREARGCALAGMIGRYLAVAGVVTLLVGSALGVVGGALTWSPTMKAGLIHLGPRVNFGYWELGFSLVLMAIYAAWWRTGKPRPSPVARSLRLFLPLLAGTNLLYHFPPLFVVLTKVMTLGVPDEEITSAGFRRYLTDPEVLSRSTHFALASFAVCGTLMMWKAARLWNDDESRNQDARRLSMWGGRLALIPTLLQLPVGFWVMLKLPRSSMMRLMGEDLPATLMLVVSLFLAFYLMHQLSKAMLGKADRRELLTTVGVMFLVVLLMTGTLHRSRAGTIEARGSRKMNQTCVLPFDSLAGARDFAIPPPISVGRRLTSLKPQASSLPPHISRLTLIEVRPVKEPPGCSTFKPESIPSADRRTASGRQV